MTPAVDRFYAKTERRGACLIWTAGVSQDGYGKFYSDGQTVRAHRWIYERLVGDPGPALRHSCDTGLCVELTHLAPGTQADNIADKVARDRQARGSGHGMAILDEQTVAMIKTALRRGDSRRDVAAEFGVKLGRVHFIAQGRAWRHVS